MNKQKIELSSVGIRLVVIGTAVCCATPPARGDAYDHQLWYRDRGRNKEQTEIQFDKDRFIEYKYPAEAFAIKKVGMWSVGHAYAPWITEFSSHVHGGMKVTPLPQKSPITLDAAVKAHLDTIHKRLKAEGAKLISITSTPAKFCGFPGRRIEQKFTFSDLPDPVVCVTHIAIGNQTEYFLEMGVFEYLYKNKTYRAMLDESAATAHPLPKAVRNTKLAATDAEIESMMDQAMSQLKEKNDPKRKIVYKYPSNWAPRNPYEMLEGETVILFDSPKNLIHCSIFAKQLLPGQTLDELIADHIHTFDHWVTKLDSTVLKNEPVKFGGHDGRHTQVRFAEHYNYEEPVHLSDKYTAICNGKVYELEIRAPESVFPVLQKLINAILNSIKF